jgi:uncharacterized protein (TIGR03790 family)
MTAASPGEEVAVVYNSAMTESRGVAEHYAKRRGVPSRQVIGLELPEREAIDRKTYLEGLENPLFKELQTRNLLTFESGSIGSAESRPVPTDAAIRYLVLCYGVPVKIQEDDSLSEAAAKDLRKELQRNSAAVDSELAGVFQRRPDAAFTGPLHNPLYQATNAADMHPTNGLMLVTRLDGPDAGTARGLVDKAIEAETNGLWGRAYFDLRGISKGNYKVGDSWIRQAAEVARAVGFETELDENQKTFEGGFPMSQIALYAGWYTPNISGPLSASEVEFMPGAFAYHLHSFSAGRLRTRDQRWVGPLLDRGVTATMGSVYEPYLLGTPNVGIFMSRFLGRQFRFAEAAYAAQSSLSWQTTVVGDPLYQPFGMPAQQRHRELAERSSPLLEWSHLRIVNLNLVNGVAEAQAVRYLENQEMTRISAVLQEKTDTLDFV